jgi:hypothetical protein
MGNLLTVPLGKLRVTQDYLNERQVLKYLNFKGMNMPPIPVAEDMILEDSFAILDGHHFSVGRHLNGEGETLVWVCESEKDFIPVGLNSPWDSSYVSRRNEQIRARYQSAPFYVPSKNGKEIFTIQELIKNCGLGSFHAIVR